MIATGNGLSDTFFEDEAAAAAAREAIAKRTLRGAGPIS